MAGGSSSTSTSASLTRPGTSWRRLEVVYRNDSQARQRQMTDEERLAFHQAESGPVMEQLRTWLSRQFEERRVEPNSGLGAAISYLRPALGEADAVSPAARCPAGQQHLRTGLEKGDPAPQECLFYKTRNGAAVGDRYMSLIHTCELNGANPFDYLTALLRHADEVAAAPAAWMPWNYQANLANLGSRVVRPALSLPKLPGRQSTKKLQACRKDTCSGSHSSERTLSRSCPWPGSIEFRNLPDGQPLGAGEFSRATAA